MLDLGRSSQRGLSRYERQRNPGVKTEELYMQAKKLDKSVGALSIRQFHARYRFRSRPRQVLGRRLRPTLALPFTLLPQEAAD